MGRRGNRREGCTGQNEVATKLFQSFLPSEFCPQRPCLPNLISGSCGDLALEMKTPPNPTLALPAAWLPLAPSCLPLPLSLPPHTANAIPTPCRTPRAAAPALASRR